MNEEEEGPPLCRCHQLTQAEAELQKSILGLILAFTKVSNFLKKLVIATGTGLLLWLTIGEKVGDFMRRIFP